MILFIGFLLILAYLPLLCFVIVDFVYFIINGSHLWTAGMLLTAHILVPFTYLAVFLSGLFDMDNSNNLVFLFPAYDLTVYILLGLSMISYFYCAYRKGLASPVMEIIVNCLLLVGIVLYIYFSILMKQAWEWIILPLPTLLLFIMTLLQNHKQAVNELGTLSAWGELPLSESRTTQFCWFLLQQKAWKKLPVLLVLCLPLMLYVVAIALLFNQEMMIHV